MQELNEHYLKCAADFTTAAELSDDRIELRLLRVLRPGDTAARPPAAQFLGEAIEYRFAIHRRNDGVRVGRIHLRLTNDPAIVEVLGHSGYAVDEAHRRRGYATCAIRLIVSLAHRCGVAPFRVMIEPDNIASRRAAEGAGLRLLDEVDTAPEALSLGVGPRLCRYGS